MFAIVERSLSFIVLWLLCLLYSVFSICVVVVWSLCLPLWSGHYLSLCCGYYLCYIVCSASLLLWHGNYLSHCGVVTMCHCGVVTICVIVVWSPFVSLWCGHHMCPCGVVAVCLIMM